jgi:Rha family phage regulatory protein
MGAVVVAIQDPQGKYYPLGSLRVLSTAPTYSPKNELVDFPKSQRGAIMSNHAQITSVVTPLVSISNNRVIATSIDIAAHFEKRHDNVLRDIKNLISQLTDDRLLNFEETVIKRQNPSDGEPMSSLAYKITRDGFALLAMGFTGKKALQFKLDFIDSYNVMEAQLLRNSTEPEQLNLPSIDVRELMLSGQAEPTSLPWDVEKAIDAKAWEMAKEAFEISREHLKRRIAYCSVMGNPKEVNVPHAHKVIQRGNLNEAMLHPYYTEVEQLRQYAETHMHFGKMLADSLDQLKHPFKR